MIINLNDIESTVVTDQIKRKLESKFIQAQGKVGEFLLE